MKNRKQKLLGAREFELDNLIGINTADEAARKKIEIRARVDEDKKKEKTELRKITKKEIDALKALEFETSKGAECRDIISIMYLFDLPFIDVQLFLSRHA